MTVEPDRCYVVARRAMDARHTPKETNTVTKTDVTPIPKKSTATARKTTAKPAAVRTPVSPVSTICAVCGNKIFRTSIKDEGTFTSAAGTFTHTGRGDEAKTWCNEPQPVFAVDTKATTSTSAKKAPAKKATTTRTTAKKAPAKPAAATAPAAIEVVDSKTQVARTAAAQAEHKALKAWSTGGKKGPKPATPNLDAMNADHAAGKKAGALRKAATPRTVQTVDFYVGERFLKGQNKLSSLAWYGTKDCGGSSSGGRMSATELKDALAKAKITEPTTTTWKWTAPNGLVLSARKPS